LKVREFSVNDPHWGRIKLVIPKHTEEGGSWGDLHPLKETEIGAQIKEVDHLLIEQAHFGFTEPLMSALGRPPNVMGKVLKGDYLCSQQKSCIMFDAKLCGVSKKTPDCYEAPFLSATLKSFDYVKCASFVILKWRENAYILISRD